jgi:hypothetical protein
LKLNGTHQVLVSADDVTILGRSVQTIEEKEESLVVASKEIGLEVIADKSKCMFMSRGQNAGRSQNMKINNGSFERVEKFYYLGTTLTNQNSVQGETKSSSNSANACYNSFKKLLYSSLLSKNLILRFTEI